MDRKHLIVKPKSNLDLGSYDPSGHCGLRSKEDAAEKLHRDIEKLATLQDVFAARKTHALLIVLQGMDAAGKDGIIKHVISGINPQGVYVRSFRQPTDEELRHDYLWRESKVLPEYGQMGIFNRSYYEEVLVVRVSRETQERENAREVADTWAERYEDINAFERHLTRCGTIVLKFFLHLSKDEQRRRLLDRLDDPSKMWKFSDADFEGHTRWDAYQRAFTEMLEHTSTDGAPWYVVPADRKWVARIVVGNIIVSALQHLSLEYPEPSEERRTAYTLLAESLREEPG
ncbi:MAG: PPK2 family polyphosphate kinase [Acidithiobacillus sp.]